MIYKPTKKCELMRTKDSYEKNVNECYEGDEQ